MPIITITQRYNAVYDAAGYIIGYSNKKSARYTVTKSQLDEILSVDNNSIDVHIVHSVQPKATRSTLKKT